MSDTEPSADRDESTERRSAGRALLALALAMLMASLGTSIANVALPTLAAAFDSSFQTVQWVVLAYLLAVTTLIVGVGRLGDLIGRRRLLLAGIVTFTVASTACAAAPTLIVLIAARAVQGVGAAILMALTLAFIADAVPRERTAGAIGLLGTMSAVGTALGPSLGGLLIDGPGWRSIFLVNLPLGLAALVLAWRHLPADRSPSGVERERFDKLGTALLATALAAYVLAVTIGDGTLGPLNLALLLAAVVGTAAFVISQRRSRSPLLRLGLLRDRRLSAGLATSALVSTVMMATLVVGPFYLSQALGLSAAAVGIAMTVGPAVAAVTALPAGRLADRTGAVRIVVLGLSAAAVGALALALLPQSLGIAGYLAPMVLLTAGYAAFQTANNATVMADLPTDRRGLVAAMLNLSRNLGLVTGASVMGAVFALAAGVSDVGSARPEDVATGMHTTFFVATVLIVVALLLASAQLRRSRTAVEAAEPAGRAFRSGLIPRLSLDGARSRNQ